ncbi:MAG: phage major capsid protein [Propionibacteriales bacterium]|nr:phage major capsid protein [Propionibacteriales bacterium]
MSETAKRLMEQRANTWNQAMELLDRAAAESRDLNAEENTAFDAMNKDIDALDARAKSILEAEQRSADMAASFEKIYDRPRTAGISTPAEDRNADRLRAFARGEVRDFTITPEYRDILKSGSGANVVPTGFYGQLWEYAVEEAAILTPGYVTQLNTDGGEALTIPKVTVHPTSSAATEGSAMTESDPTFANGSLTVAKAGFVTQISREMIDDAGVDLLGYLARAAGRELGNTIGANAVSVLLAGTTAAVTGPTGVSGAFGVQSTAGVGFDKLIDLYHSVIEPYRRRSGCAWVMSDPTAAAVRKIKSADGVYVWQPSVIPGAPDTILSKPVLIDTNVPDVALNAESVVFGDLGSLYVRIAGGVRFERSDEFAFTSDLVTFRAVVRHGALHVDPNATKSYVGAAS